MTQESIKRDKTVDLFATLSFLISSFVFLGLIGLKIYSHLNWWQWILWIIVVIILLCGFTKIPHKQVFVVEFLGKFWKIYKPGFRYVVPFVMAVRAKVDGREQSIELFSQKPNIDFKGGGTAVLVEPKVWFTVKNPYKAIYSIDNWRTGVKERTESLFRDLLNEQEVNEIISQKKLHFWWQLLKQRYQEEKDEELSDLEKTTDLEKEIEENWGIKIHRITVVDFDWSDEVVVVRKKLFESKCEIGIQEKLSEAAGYQSVADAQKMAGFHGEMTKILVNDYGVEKREANKIAQDYVLYYRGTETGCVVDWRGGEPEGSIARIVTALRLGKQISEKSKG